MVIEPPNVVALIIVAAVPACVLKVCSSVDEQPLTIVDIEFAVDDTLGDYGEPVVVTTAWGEYVGGEEGYSMQWEKVGGGIVALAVEDAEGYGYSVSVEVAVTIEFA